MGIKFANQAFGTLAAGITAAATSITLTTGQGARFPAVTAGSGDYFLLTLVSNSTGAFEIVMCVARAGDVLTIFRGLEGTTAAAFAIGDVVDNRLTAGTLTDLSAYASTSYRNKLRNPKMQIQQRGATLTNAGGYIYDGWIFTKAGAVTAACTVSDGGVILTGDAQNSFKVTVTTAQAVLGANDYGVIFQPVEGFLVRDLVGQPIAFRFEVVSSKVGTYGVTLRNRGTSPNDRYYCIPYTIATANVPQLVTLQLPVGLTTGGTWNFANGVGCDVLFSLAGGSAAAVSNAWTQGNIYWPAGQANLFDTVGATFAISAIQMERNIVPGSFEQIEIGADLMRNLRYFYRCQPVWRGACTGGAIGRAGGNHPVPMRTTPTITLTGVLGAYNGIGTASVTSISANYSTPLLAEVDLSLNVSLGAAGTAGLTYQTGTGFVDVNAEL